MKKTLLLLAILFGAAFSLHAQERENTPVVSAGFSIGVTTGHQFDDFPVAGGVHVKLEYPITDQVSAMLSAGYTFYVFSNGYSYYDDSYGSYSSGEIVNFIPVTAGVRFYPVNRLFLQGDVGASFNLNSAGYYTNNKVALLASPSIGYAFNFGQSRYGLDMSVAYDTRIESTTRIVDDSGNSAYLGGFNSVVFKLAFRFGL